MDTRREFLKKAILLSGSAKFSGIVPQSIQRALAIDPAVGSTYLNAEHIIILMQENRSFDHCFGTLNGVRGFNDPRAIKLQNKNLVWLQTNKKKRTYVPFHFNIQDTKATWMGSLPHTRSSQVKAYNRGKYDQWLESKRSGNNKYVDMPLTMGYYTREDIPFNYALADAFVVCDQNFCSVLSGTWPNRLYLWSGTVRGEESGMAKAYVRNDIPYGEAHWKTFPERLEENGISWKVYQNDISTGGGLSKGQREWLTNVTGNPLEFLSQYNVRFYPRYVESLRKRANILPLQIANVEKKLQSVNLEEKERQKLLIEIAKKKEVLADTKLQLKKWGKENFEKLSIFQKNIYKRAFTTNVGDPDYRKLTTFSYEENGKKRHLLIPKGDVLYQFRKDVGTGQLPVISWIVPPRNLSGHPNAPWYGSWYVSEILDILTKNPDIWKKVIFIMTYDENDGYFDHIPPFIPPDPQNPSTGRCSKGINTAVEFVRRKQELQEGVAKKRATEGPIGLGYRVPMIIASPWSRGGKVCSQVFDHTSVLQFLERFIEKKYNINIKASNISLWRRTITGDLTAAFSVYKGSRLEKLPFVTKRPFFEKIYNAKFKNRPSDFKPLSEVEIKQININSTHSFLMPQQERGIRPSCPLPYQLYAEGRLSADRRGFEITMEAKNEVFGKATSGAPFYIYNFFWNFPLTDENENKTELDSNYIRNYAVMPGDKLSDIYLLDKLENQKYHFQVYGPNGFFREFIGNMNDPSIQVICEYEQIFKNELSGNIELKIINLDRNNFYNVEIFDNLYKNIHSIRKVVSGTEISILLSLGKSYNWYDFTLRVKGHLHFMKRCAGHVETGEQSYSDPSMGKVLDRV